MSKNYTIVSAWFNSLANPNLLVLSVPYNLVLYTTVEHMELAQTTRRCFDPTDSKTSYIVTPDQEEADWSHKFRMVHQAIQQNRFQSSHFCWCSFQLVQGMPQLDEVLASFRSKFSLCLTSYSRGSIDTPASYEFGTDFFTGELTYITRVCELVEQEVSSSDPENQVLSRLYDLLTRSFQLYYGTAIDAIDNYLYCHNNAPHVLEKIILGAWNAQNVPLCKEAGDYLLMSLCCKRTCKLNQTQVQSLWQVFEQAALALDPALPASIDKIEYCGNPGREHYKLLDFVSRAYHHTTILDVGTQRGRSCFAMGKANLTNIIHTFDIVDKVQTRSEFPSNVFFRLANLWDEATFRAHLDLIKSASVIFLDVDPHDGTMELDFYIKLKAIQWPGILLLDDIHLSPEMEKLFWNRIPDAEKLDLTDKGHWSGTGVICLDPQNLAEFQFLYQKL